MAQVVLSSIGQAVAGAPGGLIGGLIGAGVDQTLLGELAPARQRGPRLEGLKLQGTAEGAPISFVLGRARVTGQIIWAARFREDRRTSSGSKGAPRTVEYGYSLSFAVALCEGEIDGVGRVWADGQPLDMSGVTFRVHRGGEEQAPDPLIEAIETEAPAYRGTAYVVFEDLPLGPYGNRVPQLSFEVFRRARGDEPRLEDRVEGVCLIPGAGEFSLAVEPVVRREGLSRTHTENAHMGGAADLLVSLDLLQTQLPNLKRVSLVIGWFGDDLRASHCRVRPGVDQREKSTEPLIWSVAGVGRAEAHLISHADGGPAFGGTPSDDSVRQAVAELKGRGLEVTLYPFLFMDIPEGNALSQPAYPWRGRLQGRAGEAAAEDVAAVFGDAGGWGLRRMALHYASLAAETGADGLLIGSEMGGLTSTRDDAGGYPAVDAYRSLAEECRGIVGPDTALSYAADWSEYAGVREGSEAIFHLDPLWAHPDIDYVGIDWYPPLGDWRADAGGVDAAGYAGPDDPAYLANQVAGGEGFDWFYASEEDREAQVRTPISDGLGEDWVFRVKDLAGWWGHAHHDRPGGVRNATPTGWTPGMKPVRLTEFGCAAVDRGGNAPNLFQDPKSAEHGLPPWSTGRRDDRMQRRAVEAVLQHFAEGGPVSDVYGAPMMEAMDVWCWDARPFPAFPARDDVWGDTAGWRCGHWLNGRLEGEASDLIAAILRRGEVERFDVTGVSGDVRGYVLDRPMPTRSALEPLGNALGLSLVEREGGISVLAGSVVVHDIDEAVLALPDEGPALRADRRLEAKPAGARVRFIDGDRDYQTGSAFVRGSGQAGHVDLDLPAVCSKGLARMAAERALGEGEQERLTVTLGPLDALRLEPGDVVGVTGRAGEWRVASLDLAEAVTAVLEPVRRLTSDEVLDPPWIGGTGVVGFGAPFFRMIDAPPLPWAEEDARPLVIAAADPWKPLEVRAGPTAEALSVRAAVAQPATIGVLQFALGAGPRHRWDRVSDIVVRVEGVAPESRTEAAVLGGANMILVESAGGWEVVQFRRADLVGEEVWRLSGLLRGQVGTERAMRAGAAPGAVVVFVGPETPRATSPSAEVGLDLIWRAGPTGLPGGATVRELSFRREDIHSRPFSPAHLKTRRAGDGGLELAWTPRRAVGGDNWDRDLVDAASWKFRVRLGDGAFAHEVETSTPSAAFTADELALHFPDGLTAAATAEVSQWGADYGWGEAAVVRV